LADHRSIALDIESQCGVVSVNEVLKLPWGHYSGRMQCPRAKPGWHCVGTFEKQPIARPGVVGEICHKAGLERITFHVPDCKLQIQVFLDQTGVEASFEQRTVEAVATIELANVRALYEVEGSAQASLRCLDDEMNVITHEAESENQDPESLMGSINQLKKVGSILVTKEDGLATQSSVGDVVKGSWVVDTKWAGHQQLPWLDVGAGEASKETLLRG